MALLRVGRLSYTEAYISIPHEYAVGRGSALT